MGKGTGTEVIDQTGRAVHLNKPVRRIVSLVPSQTELLADLGLDREVVGITKFCVHPEHWFRSKKRVGGTKSLHIETILKMAPDLVLANKEENEKTQIEELAQSLPVWVSDIKTLEEAYDMITSVGELTSMQPEANKTVIEIKNEFQALKSVKNNPTVAYFIWNQPMMCAGRNTFIDEMLQLCGFRNIFEKEEGRYPEVTAEVIGQKKPDFIFLSSEPFPFKKQHVLQYLASFPDSIVKQVDGEIFSWYGSRLKKAPAYLNGLINFAEKELNT